MTTDRDIKCSEYSDLYKDVRGFRPSGFTHLTDAELDRRIGALQDELDEQLAADEFDDYLRFIKD